MFALPEHLRSELEKFNQTHVVRFWDELDDQQRRALVEDLESVDLALLRELYDSPAEEVDWQALAAQAEPPTAIRVSDQQDPNLLERARELGEESLRNGEVAVVIVAGAKGPVWGFLNPRGCFRSAHCQTVHFFRCYLIKSKHERIAMAGPFRSC